MRQLNFTACGPAQRVAPRRGMTLVELMVAISILGLLVMAAAPNFADYTSNSRLREAGTLLQTELLIAQSEAVKRNRIVRLTTAGSTVRVYEANDAANPVLLRERILNGGASAGTSTVDFSPRGFPVDRSVAPTVDFVAAAIDISLPGVTCSADYRCPGLRVDAGGGIRICPNKLVNCS